LYCVTWDAPLGGSLYAGTYTNPYTHAHGYPHSYANRYLYPDGNRYPYPYPYPDAYAHAHTKPYADTNRYTDSLATCGHSNPISVRLARSA